MDEMGLSEDHIESLIENSNIHYFRRGLTAQEFVNSASKAVTLSENLGMPVNELPNYIAQKELELDKLKGETVEAKIKQLEVL
jgi:hypothetical protein